MSVPIFYEFVNILEVMPVQSNLAISYRLFG